MKFQCRKRTDIMNIYFIMGSPHSGKTTFINKFFDSEAIIVDILDSEVVNTDPQKALLSARLNLEVALNKGHLNNRDVVFEFPGLTAKQRSFFLRKVMFNKTKNDKLYGVWVTVPDDVVIGRLNAGGHDGKSIAVELRDIIEAPQIDEGFDALFLYHGEEYIPTADEYVLTQAKYHCDYEGNVVEEAQSLFEQWSKGK